MYTVYHVIKADCSLSCLVKKQFVSCNAFPNPPYVFTEQELCFDCMVGYAHSKINVSKVTWI